MNDKDGTFTSLPDFASGEFPKFAAVADFTGDNIPDLAVTNATLDMVSISLGKGDGTFTYPPIYHEVAEYPQGMVIADFNNDGLLDIAVSSRDENKISLLLKKNMVNPSPFAN
ncbi:MAG: VCBS repeat-containing protein [Proteobacteria bacterium]|nr:VCBS repeat-containing protein [Pseudomonadota bacterium]